MRGGYRVIDVDSHVTPSLEVLHRHADTGLKARWDEFAPFVRTMNSPPGRGHPEEPWTTLKINPIPYDRVAGHKGDAGEAQEGGAGALAGRVQNIASEICSPRIQHDNSTGRLADMEREGVDVNCLIPGTWASAATALDPSLAVGLYGAYHEIVNLSRLTDPASEVVSILGPVCETGDRLDYMAVVTDPGTFTEPATLVGAWHWNPGEEIKPFQCALPDGGP